jgi:hypothetical protein
MQRVGLFLPVQIVESNGELQPAIEVPSGPLLPAPQFESVADKIVG